MAITAMAFTKRKTSQEDSRSGAQIAFTRDDQGLDTVPSSAPAAEPEGGPVRHQVIFRSCAFSRVSSPGLPAPPC